MGSHWQVPVEWLKYHARDDEPIKNAGLDHVLTIIAICHFGIIKKTSSVARRFSLPEGLIHALARISLQRTALRLLYPGGSSLPTRISNTIEADSSDFCLVIVSRSLAPFPSLAYGLFCEGDGLREISL